MWLRIVKLLVTVGVVVALLMGVLWLWASHRDKVVQQAWAVSRYGSLGALPTRFPTTPANPQALRLEELVARLGLDLVPRSVKSRKGPTKELRAAFTKVRLAARNYANGQLARADDRIDHAPQELVAFLVSREQEMVALRHLLISGGAPLWEMAFDKGFEAPIPNLLGIFDLQFLLIADALEQTRAGNQAAAAESLEASWQLSGGLWRRPELISQLIAVASATLQAGAARRVQLPEAWATRFERLDPLAGFLDAFAGEAWAMRDALSRRSVPEIKRALDGLPLWVPINRPWLMLSIASHNEAMLRLVSYLAERPLCSVDFVAPNPVFAPHFPAWDIIGRIAWPDMRMPCARILRLQLDLELSALVLRLRSAQRADGRWPSELPGAVSRACPTANWAYRVNADGTAALAFAGKLPAWPKEPQRLKLPLEHVLRAPTAAPTSGQ